MKTGNHLYNKIGIHLITIILSAICIYLWLYMSYQLHIMIMNWINTIDSQINEFYGTKDILKWLFEFLIPIAFYISTPIFILQTCYKEFLNFLYKLSQKYY